MPDAPAQDGTRLYYELHQAGDLAPVIIALAGLGTSGRLYDNAIGSGMRSGFSVLTMDTRGTGRSRSASRTWTMGTCADDVVAVLDHAGIRRAHVSGASLGGMVAQEVAIRHPGRTAALLLSSTTGGWPRLDLFHRGALLALARSAVNGIRTPPPKEVRRARALRTWFSPDFARDLGPGAPAWEALSALLDEPASGSGRAGQLIAALRHSTWRRLDRIRAPTLIQHGAQDAVVKPRAGLELACRIPGARFQLWPQAGHALGLEIPDAAYGVAVRFLQAHHGLG
jgi:3-oxoadipate enol-lactonase